jgi:hypothetical protein
MKTGWLWSQFEEKFRICFPKLINQHQYNDEAQHKYTSILQTSFSSVIAFDRHIYYSSLKLFLYCNTDVQRIWMKNIFVVVSCYFIENTEQMCDTKH